MKYPALFLMALVPISANSADYYCEATAKYDANGAYSAEQMSKSRFATKVEERAGEVYLSRCSFSERLGKVTCDEYKVDRVEFTPNVNIKKFYVFKSQFDFQIFSNLSSIENNGRGSVQYGTCRVTSP